MAAINLSIEPNLDTWLTETQERITGERRVDAVRAEAEVPKQIEEACEDLHDRPSSRTLDLIAHAYEGVLHFGHWRIEAGAPIRADFLASVEKMRPASIRLLGCFTAEQQGRAALQYLQEVLERRLKTTIPIFGTNNILFADHFGPAGLNSRGEQLLISSQDLPPEPDAQQAPVPPGPGGPRGGGSMVQSHELVERAFKQLRQLDVPSVREVLARLRPETLDQATHNQRYTSTNRGWAIECLPPEALSLRRDQLIPELATAPGLLAVPDAEELYPAPVTGPFARPRFHRVTILFGGRFVRVYPEAYPEGVILRSRQVLRLEGGTPASLLAFREASGTSAVS